MFRSSRVAVVVPAFNEEDRILATLRSIPQFIDHVLVVDDASVDRTAAIARGHVRRGSCATPRTAAWAQPSRLDTGVLSSSTSTSPW
jgi:hypothetical protein